MLPILVFSIVSCGNEAQPIVEDATSEKVEVKEETVSKFRAVVKENPVASYSVKTDDELNDWYFKLNIFETAETFKYLMKFQYEEVRGEDTLKLPEAGKPLLPVVKKGPEKYSVIIGFEDPEDGSFREYKKLLVENNTLKLKTLKYYATMSE